MYGGQLAMCNDLTIKTQKDCVGGFYREYFVTRLALEKRPNVAPAAPAAASASGAAATKRGDPFPPAPPQTIWVPRVFANPRNFDFDTIGNAMLALFEVLSLEGWLEVKTQCLII